MAPTAAERPLVLVLAGPGTAFDELRQALHLGGVEVCDVAGADGRRPDVVVAEAVLLPVREQDLQGVPVLAVVDREATQEVGRALAAGATDVLARPFHDHEVRARVAGASAVSRAALRNDELGAWAARAAHDMKTPLAVISGMAETLDAAWDRLGADDRARMLTSIRTQAAKAMTMVDDAVAMARGAPPLDR